MGSVKKFVERMLYWCNEGNLGYDQSNRWDIRVGGECDCSSLVIHSAREAGFNTGNASYTGDIEPNFVANGWKTRKPDGNPKVGEILLNRANHVAVCTGNNQMSYASLDENGRITGGQAGDQTGNETKTVQGTSYSRGWDVYLYYPESDVSGYVAPTSSGNPTLQRGAYGQDVIVLQQKLVSKGYSVGSSGIDGSFGADTLAAVRRFQQDNGLEVDGIVGPLTWAALNATVTEQTGSLSADDYTTGKYVTLTELNVRTGPGADWPLVLVAGEAKVVAQDTPIMVTLIQREGSEVWGRITSGWVALYYNGTSYARRTK